MPHRDEMNDLLEAELAPLLAAEKPVPRPEFVRELDERVAARFPRRRRRRSRWTAALWRPQLAVAAGALAAAVIAIVVVTGSNSGGGGGSARTALLDQRAPSAKSAAPSAGAAGGSVQSEAAPSGTAAAAPNVAPSPTRRVERSTNLVLSVRRNRIQDAAQRVFGIVTAAGGVVQSSNVASGEGAGASFDLRIPASRVTRTVGQLARLGHVRSETNSTLDVTKSYTTLTTRLADATAERAGLLRQLAKAVTANQTASIKARLRLVETRINALRRSQRALRNRTAYARVSLELVPQRGAVVAPAHHHRLTPARALHDAGHVLAVAASVALLALAVALPVAVLALLGWLATRPVVRRRREHALDVA
jgi:Domain of unknown function (DUF4349)